MFSSPKTSISFLTVVDQLKMTGGQESAMAGARYQTWEVLNTGLAPVAASVKNDAAPAQKRNLPVARARGSGTYMDLQGT